MMGSQGKYAGQPHSFACSKCRRSFAFKSDNGVGRNWTTTGKTRAQLSSGMNYHRWPDTAYQYRCLDCGHVGWSRHPSVMHRHNKEHGGSDE